MSDLTYKKKPHDISSRREILDPVPCTASDLKYDPWMSQNRADSGDEKEDFIQNQ